MQKQIDGFDQIHLGPVYDQSTAILQIRAPESVNEAGTVLINDAALDVCVECGTFYAANAKQLAQEIEKETFMLDPLGVLAEVARPDEAPEG